MSRLCSKQSGYADSIGNAVCTNAWVLETLTDLLDWASALSQLLLQITLQQQVPHSSESITLQHQPPNSSVSICYLGQTLPSFARYVFPFPSFISTINILLMFIYKIQFRTQLLLSDMSPYFCCTWWESVTVNPNKPFSPRVAFG